MTTKDSSIAGLAERELMIARVFNALLSKPGLNQNICWVSTEVGLKSFPVKKGKFRPPLAGYAQGKLT